ncbi:MAG: ATP-binding protein [Gemmatimonadales bacterium]
MSLRLRFFVVVWTLLVVGLVGLGALLGRWSTVEISRVTAEAQIERMLGDAGQDLVKAVLLAPSRDSAAVSALLAERVAADSFVQGVAVLDAAGRVVASALPPMNPGEFTTLPDGQFEWRREETSDGRRAAIRLIGNGRLIDPRDSLDPRYLVVLPTLHANVSTAIADARPAASVALAARVRWALLIGSILAAVVTLAISGPLLGRVGELSRAVARLGRGDLAARVAVRGGDEIARLGAAFNTMAGDLERAESQRRQMVTDVAHELRTPLTNITGLLEAIEDGLRAADAETLGALREEAGLLAGLIDDLRDLSLAESGHLQLTVEPIDAADAVRRAVDGFDRRHAIVVDVPEHPVMVQADARRLGQVVRNLIQNAVTHSPAPQSVTVTLVRSPHPVTLREPARSAGDRRGGGSPSDGSAPSDPFASLRVPQGDSVHVTITDHGPGIPPDELPRIWDRFYRTDASRSRATGGMGLGLPVARHLVEAMGGTIRVTSAVGQGSRFTVELAGSGDAS